MKQLELFFEKKCECSPKEFVYYYYLGFQEDFRDGLFLYNCGNCGTTKGKRIC